MKRDVQGPKQPYLELGFYYDTGKSEKAMFIEFVQALIKLGAKVAGKGMIARPEGIEKMPGLVYAIDSERVSFTPGDFPSLLHDPNSFLWTVYFYDLIGLAEDGRAEEATLSLIPKKYESEDHHPFAIYTEDVFRSKSRNDITPKIAQAGSKVVSRFFDVINATHPAYAAITHFTALECPSELRDKPGGLSFSDFYVSNDYMGSVGIEKLQKLYSEAYIESLSSGLYISCWPFFNSNRNYQSPPWIAASEIIGHGINWKPRS